jgi:hypothetical protein
VEKTLVTRNHFLPALSGWVKKCFPEAFPGSIFMPPIRVGGSGERRDEQGFAIQDQYPDPTVISIRERERPRKTGNW